jgi:hypothetical protein
LILKIILKKARRRCLFENIDKIWSGSDSPIEEKIIEGKKKHLVLFWALFIFAPIGWN